MLTNRAQIAVTIDVDWAPDFVIDFVAQILIDSGVHSTWFVTHASPAIDRLRRRPQLFELGIHPNFLPGSSHGDTPSDILEHCLRLVPDANSLRTHNLIQSERLLAAIIKTERLTVDVTTFLPHAKGLQMVRYETGGKHLWRIPFFWEDYYETQCRTAVWNPESLLELKGLRVFSFHPIHVYLNSARLDGYEALKRCVPQMHEATLDDVAPLIYDGPGTRSAFLRLVDRLRIAGHGCCIRDLVEMEASSCC